MDTLRTLADKSTGEDKRCLVEKVEEVRKAIVGLRKQATGEDLQRVAELEESLKKLEEEMPPWSVEEEQEQRRQEEQRRQGEQEDQRRQVEQRRQGEQEEQRRQEEQKQRRQEERERAAMRNVATSARMAAKTTTVASATTGARDKRMNEACGKSKGKGKGGKGEHGGKGGKGFQQSVKMLKGEEEQTDEEDERVQVAPNMGVGGSQRRERNTKAEMGGLRRQGRRGRMEEESEVVRLQRWRAGRTRGNSKRKR